MTVATLAQVGYDDRGSGEPALLCLPGWCGARTEFDPLLPLVSRHRRIVSMDLRDQGGSERGGADFGSDDVVADAVALADRLGLDRFVPVAGSHAGWFAIELRRRLGPDRVPAIVLLDWMVLGPPPGFMDALASLQHEWAWEAVRAALFELWTRGVEVPAVHDYVQDMGTYGFRHWSRAGREIAAAFAAEAAPLAALERLDEPCPTLHVYAQPRDEAFLAAQQDYSRRNSWFRVRRLDAASHFPTFEVPGAVADAVEEFVCAI